MTDVTVLLDAIKQGNGQAVNELLPLVYDELRLLAVRMLSQEAPGQTLQATALVHEAYLRLAGADEHDWKDRHHFFAVAAEAMRRILIDNARHKKSLKQGGNYQRIPLDQVDIAIAMPPEHLVALDEALSRLAADEPEVAELVKIRFYLGQTIEQAAELMGITPRTAYRYWAYARARLHQELVVKD